MLPVSLKLKNFFSHKDNFVDFSKFNSALLIGNVEGNYDISNGSGKSTIFEAILWCLFNKSRGTPMDDIIFWGEDKCSVELVFRHKLETYKIVRTRSRISSTSGVKFYQLNYNNEWVDLSGSTPSLTNEVIVDTIKLDWKTFVNSAYFRQNDISEFAESDASRKKTILKSIIDISKWDEYEKEAKAKAKELNTELTILNNSVKDFDETNSELRITGNSFKALKEEVERKTARRNELEKLISELSSKYAKIKQTLDTNTWDKIVEENTSLKKKFEHTDKKILSNTNRQQGIEKEIAKCQKDIGWLEEKISNLEIIDNVEEILKEKHDQFIKFKSDLLSAEEILKVIRDKKIVPGECYICEQSIDDELFDKLTHDHEEQIDMYEKKIIYSKNKIAEYNHNIKELEVFKKNENQKNKLLANIKSMQGDLVVLKSTMATLKEDYELLAEESSEFRRKIDINRQILNSLRNDDFQKLHDEIDSLKAEKVTLISEIEVGNRKLGVLFEKISGYKRRIEEMKSVKKTLNEKNKQALVFEKMIKMLGKNGIQTILLNAVIEDLEKTANNILNSICNEPFVVMLETQRLHSDGVSIVDTLDLKIRKSGIAMNFANLSGGEQFRISLALRIALSEISSRHGGSNLEFLLLDEINQPLDRHGTENLFVNVIKSLEKKYKILVITHDDSLKEKFENVINITNINGESSAEFIAR